MHDPESGQYLHDFKEKVHYSLSQDCSNGWSMGRARLHFLPLLLCCAAQSNLFARGGGGVCNHLLDYGHLQVYLWMIIKQYIYVHFGAEQFNCLSCFFLYTFSPSATFWLSEGIWECLIGFWTLDSRIWSASGSVYCLGVGSEMMPIHMCHLLIGEKFSCCGNLLSEELFFT